MKKKPKMKMFFHCAGVTSEEVLRIKSQTEEQTILFYNQFEEREWIFDNRTGRCLNDDNSFGARRTILPISPSNTKKR